MNESLTRPLAVVTGASSGIGFELAKQFASGGFDVLVAAEDHAIETAAPQIAGTSRAQVTPVQVDLRTPAGVETLYDKILLAERPVDALALNAGIGQGGRFVETSLDGDLDVIALNVTSVVHLAKRVLPGMVARKHGRVLITASVVSTMPGPFYATYAASKAFDLSFAEALRHELKDTGVTVTALMPGPTETKFFARAHLQDTRMGMAPKDDPAEVAAQGFAAMMRGEDHVVAGSKKNLAQVLGAKVIPEKIKALLHARQVEPPSRAA